MLLENLFAQRRHAAQLTADSNIFVERIWRSIKYEEVYLHAYDSVAQAKAGIARYIDFYNVRRPHSSLDKRTPDEFYFATLPAMKEAA